ncbi:MAG: 50S ribosomal protein L25, partial [Actinobacteria bacterium]|nr:50S ribosomal protein L25 [Actinomycetota bacterium]
ARGLKKISLVRKDLAERLEFVPEELLAVVSDDEVESAKPVFRFSEVGKIANRRLRAAGKIPGVVYGRDEDAVAVAVDAHVFSKTVPEANWFSAVIKLHIEGGEAEDRESSVMIREVQRDLVGRRLLSIDFLRISLEEAVRAHIPLVTVGESPGIKQGGILDQISHEVTVECLPGEMPDHLEIDISGMAIGDSLRVRDLVAPPGVTLTGQPDDVLVVLAPPVRIEEVAAEAEMIEGALVEETAEPEVIGERKGEEQR